MTVRPLAARLVFILCALVFFAVPVSAAVDDIVARTNDRDDVPYRWSGAICTMGESDVVIQTNRRAAREGGGGGLHFVFRNFRAAIVALTDRTLTMEVTSTRTMGMTFTDREQTVWAFQPSRNRARCFLRFRKGGKRGLTVWGSCAKLLPRDARETFTNHIEIAEASPLRCELEDTVLP